MTEGAQQPADDRPQIIITDSPEALEAARRLFPSLEARYVNGEADLSWAATRRLVLMPTAGREAEAQLLADKLVSIVSELKACWPEPTRAEGWSIASEPEWTNAQAGPWAVSVRETIPIPAPQGGDGESPARAEPPTPSSGGSPDQSPAAAGPPEHHDAAPWHLEEEQGRSAAPRRLKPPAKRYSGTNGERSQTAEGLLYVNASTVTPRAVRWLWKGRIPRGKVSIIAGDPGLGKSQVCASLASIVTNGSSWPVDRTSCDEGSVLILSAEDDPGDTLRPRLDAAGAQIDRIYFLQAVKYQGRKYDPEARVYVDTAEAERTFNLGEDLEKAKALLYKIGDVRLFVIDPVSAYLGITDSHKNAEVRAMMTPLAALAEETDCAIVLVSHLTKGQSGSVLARIQGSVAFGAAARAVWGVTKDHDNPQRRLFMPMKNNVGKDDSGFAYTIESVSQRSPEDDDEIETSRVMWEPELVTSSVEDAFSMNLNNEERNELAEAKEFLANTLAQGPVSSKQIKADAEGAGHSWATLRRAQSALKVRAHKEGFQGPWMWALPAKD